MPLSFVAGRSVRCVCIECSLRRRRQPSFELPKQLSFCPSLSSSSSFVSQLALSRLLRLPSANGFGACPPASPPGSTAPLCQYSSSLSLSLPPSPLSLSLSLSHSPLSLSLACLFRLDRLESEWPPVSSPVAAAATRVLGKHTRIRTDQLFPANSKAHLQCPAEGSSFLTASHWR